MKLDNFKKLLWPVAILLLLASPAVSAVDKSGQDTVRVKGTIQTVDTQSGKTENVPSVIIRIKETQSAVVTNGNGDFRFTYVPGRDTITLMISDPLFDKTQIMLTNVHLQEEIDLGRIMLKQAPPSQQEREPKRSGIRKQHHK